MQFAAGELPRNWDTGQFPGEKDELVEKQNLESRRTSLSGRREGAQGIEQSPRGKEEIRN